MEQRHTYDTAVLLWRDLFCYAKSGSTGAFWSAQQRFFKALLTSFKVPLLLSSVKAALNEGCSVVVGLTSTGEAYLEGEATVPANPMPQAPANSLPHVTQQAETQNGIEDTIEGGRGSEAEAGERSAVGGGATLGKASAELSQQYTHGVGARPKTAQEAWAMAMMGEARDKEGLQSVAAHSEQLVARVLAELN